MPGILAPVGHQQFLTNAGAPNASGTLETYAAGTSTPLATWSDLALSVANPTTITLNSAGRPSVGGSEVALFLPPGTNYKFVLKDSGGTEIWTQDDLAVTVSGDVDITGTAGEALSAGDVVYLSDGSGGATAGRWYKTDSDNTYSSTAAPLVGMVQDAISSGSDGQVRLAGKITGLSGLVAGTAYYVSATAGALTGTAPANRRLVGTAESTTVMVLSVFPAMGLMASGTASSTTYLRGDLAWSPFPWQIVFLPQQNEPPAASYATPDTRNGHPVLDFDGSSDEEAVFSAVLPSSYNAGGVTVETWWAFTSATSGSLRVQVALEVMVESQDLDSDGFAAFQSAGGTAPGTSGELVQVDVVLTDGAQMDGVTGGEPFRLKIRRDADGTSGTDDIATDAELRMVRMRET